MTYLYALVDPAEPEKVRYIGIAKDVEARRVGHLDEVRQSRQTFTPKTRWMWSLITNGRVPMLRVLACLEDEEAPLVEQYAITSYLAAGHPLTNSRVMEETGVVGHSEEARTKLSKASREMWADPERRARILASRNTPEVRERQRNGIRKAWSSPEYRAKIESTNSRPEVRAKRSKALKAANANPEAHARSSRTMNRLWATPEFRSKMDRVLAENRDEALAKAAAVRAARYAEKLQREADRLRAEADRLEAERLASTEK